MSITNIRIQDKELKVKNCTGLKSLKGLMFSDMKNIHGALIHGNSVWMPFVRYDLVLFFLSSNYKILEIQKASPISLNPGTWKTYSCKHASYCLELKTNLIQNPHSMIGKEIKIV